MSLVHVQSPVTYTRDPHDIPFLPCLRSLSPAAPIPSPTPSLLSSPAAPLRAQRSRPRMRAGLVPSIHFTTVQGRRSRIELSDRVAVEVCRRT